MCKSECFKLSYNNMQSLDYASMMAANNDLIDLVLMYIDIGKGMNGTEASEIILKAREIPLVFLSSHIEPEIVRKTEQITSYNAIFF